MGEYVKVKLTLARLRAVPEGQPPRLLKDVVALAMHINRKATVNMSGLANNPRMFLALRMNTFPLRPADVLTTCAVQGGELERSVIHETSPSEFYTPLS